MNGTAALSFHLREGISADEKKCPDAGNQNKWPCNLFRGKNVRRVKKSCKAFTVGTCNKIRSLIAFFVDNIIEGPCNLCNQTSLIITYQL